MGGGGGSKSQVTGYKYWGAMHLVLCHAGIDVIDRIRIAEKTLSRESITRFNNLKLVSAWNAFGGDKREGGPYGFLKFFFGDDDQAVSRVTESLYSTGMAYRGVVSVVMPKMYFSANNPYIKPWSFRVQSFPPTPGLGRSKMKIPGTHGAVNMNPAHIIYAVLVGRSDRWGLGLQPGNDIDVESFARAADVLYSEKFGLGLSWDNNSGVDDFIAEILRHIDGGMYVDQTTGRLVLRLFRGDYSISNLDTIDNKIVKDLEKFEYPQWGNITTQVTVTYTDAAEGKKKPITVHNMAASDVQGRDVSVDLDFPGINSLWLASRVASRELNQLSRRLVNGTLICNRKASKYNIGDVVLVNLPERDLERRVMRVVEKAFGSETRNEVRLTVVEDTFKSVDPLVDDSASSEWTSPDKAPEKVDGQLAVEVPYWEITQMIGDLPVDLDKLGDSYGFVRTFATSDVGYGYDCWATSGGESGSYEYLGNGQFTNMGKLSAPLPATTPAETTITVKDMQDVSLISENVPVMIGSEMCWVKNLDLTNNAITVVRGINDTVPTDHAADTAVWFYRDVAVGYVGEKYNVGQEIHTKLLTKTPSGVLGLDAADATAVRIVGRAIKPYPPAKLEIGGGYLRENAEGSLVISWSSRNRLTQSDKVPLSQADNSIPPEPDTTYNLRVLKDSDKSELKEETGMTVLTKTYAFDEVSYSLTKGEKVIIELESARKHGSTTLKSHSKWEHKVLWGPDANHPETTTVDGGSVISSLPYNDSNVSLYYADSELLFRVNITAETASGGLVVAWSQASGGAGAGVLQIQKDAAPTDDSHLLQDSGDLPLVLRPADMTAGEYYIRVKNSRGVKGSTLSIGQVARVELTLTNPSAATGDTSGWTDEVGVMRVRENNPRPHTYPNSFAGGLEDMSVASQSVTLTTALSKTEAELDAANMLMRVEWYQRSFGDTGEGGIGIRAKGASGELLGEAVAQVVHTDKHGWTKRERELRLPTGTRTVEIVQSYARKSDNGYIDTISSSILVW